LIIVDDASEIDKVKDLDFGGTSEPSQKTQPEENKATDNTPPAQAGPVNTSPVTNDIKILQETWQEVTYEFEGKQYFAQKEALDFIQKNGFDLKELCTKGNGGINKRLLLSDVKHELG